MEISGVIARQPPCFSTGAGGGLGDQGRVGVPLRPRRILNGFGVVNNDHHVSSGFRDNGHLQYYYGEGLTLRCGGKKKEKETSTKKKLKLLKVMSRELSAVSPRDGLVGDVQANMISEATEVLMKQLQQLRAEEKELKRKKEEEKSKLKAAKMKTMLACESSESSDSECGEVIDMNWLLRNEASAETVIGESEPILQVDPTPILPILLPQESNTIEANRLHHNTSGSHGNESSCGPSTSYTDASRVSSNGINSIMTAGTSAKRIEVCMGNKCKKSGSVALLEKFERAVGVEGAVAGCKCMGKCRDGPNVRVLSSVEERVADSVRTPVNPLYIGVGLEDVDVIVAKFLGKDLRVALAT